MRRSWIGTAALALAMLGATAAQAETFDAAISEHTVRLDVNGPLSRLFAVDKGEYDIGVIGGDIDDNDDERYLAAHAGALLTGDAGGGSSASLNAGLGARFQFVGADGEHGGALALGGQLRMKLLQANRLRFNAALWYGPEAASFGDFDQYLEYSASIGYELLRDAEIYVGYRRIEVDLDSGPDVDLEDGLHLGIRLEF